jgi:hypothetical protein
MNSLADFSSITAFSTFSAPQLHRIDFTYFTPAIQNFLEKCAGVQTVAILGFRPGEERLEFTNPVKKLPNLREIHFEIFGPILLLYFCWMFPGVTEVHAETSNTKQLSNHLTDLSAVSPESFQSMKVRLVVSGQEPQCSTTDVWSLYNVLKTPQQRLRVSHLTIDPTKRAHNLQMLARKGNHTFLQ